MDIEQVKERLRSELESLKQMSADSKGSRDTVNLDQQSIGRLSRMDAMQAQAMAKRTEQRRQTQIKRIESTLKRIENDDFGFCVMCGEEISEKRLEFDPTTTQCTNCMNG